MAPAGEGEARHEPVMVAEVTGFLGGRGTVVDMTVGLGGHAEALLEAGVGHVLGVDRDEAALQRATERLTRYGERFRPMHATFSEAPVEAPVDGVLYDLGVSSMQLDEASRGFSYRLDGSLDMRMDPGEGPSAKDLVNTLPEEELARVLFEYGEERRSRQVARAILRARARRPFETTDDLVRVVAGAVGGRRGGPHPARRTFQALRIAVNRELEELSVSLPRAVGLLAPGGRVVVIAYHSLEDRIVKRYFLGEQGLRVLTRRPLRPSEEETTRNPRARSARLRAAELSEEAA